MCFHYSRLCLQAPVLGHIVRRNIALQLLARAGAPFLQVPGEPPALVGSVQDLELVARTEAQVLRSPRLVIKQGHKVGALRPGSLRGTGALCVLRRHLFVCLLGEAGETCLQVPPEPQADVAHAALPLGRGGERGCSPSPLCLCRVAFSSCQQPCNQHRLPRLRGTPGLLGRLARLLVAAVPQQRRVAAGQLFSGKMPLLVVRLGIPQQKSKSEASL